MVTDDTSLIDRLAARLHCVSVSDLRYLDHTQRTLLLHELRNIPAKDDDLFDWNDALDYLVDAPPEKTSAAAKERLIALLSAPQNRLRSIECEYKDKTGMAETSIGTQIGMLTVIERLPADEWHRSRWRCECDCGGETILNSAQIRRGIPNHCGCQKKVMRSDLTGQRIGKLEVLGPSDKRGKRGKRTVPLWECRCECGEICYKATDTLTDPSVSMCAKCADISHTTKARAKAGFVDGTQITKLRDMTPPVNNTTGVRGVRYNKRDNKWYAYLKFKGKEMHLGSYSNMASAVRARKEAEEEYYGTFLASHDNSDAV